MMGVGKTSVATALAEATGRRCVDTDGLIVEKHGEINRILPSMARRISVIWKRTRRELFLQRTG